MERDVDLLERKLEREIERLEEKFDRELRRLERSIMQDIKNHFYLLLAFFFILALKVIALSVQ